MGEVYKKRKTVIYLAVILFAILGMKLPSKAAVTQADLANPVMDEESHKVKSETDTHITEYKYVYFGNYPQTELKGNEITDAIKNASYDTYGNATIDGRQYRRITYEMTTISGLWNGRPENFARKATDGYRYFVYEPIKWKILDNEDGTLFLWSDLALDVQLMSYSSGADNRWENSELRKWLNYDGTVQVPVGRYYKNPGFMEYAFTNAEQEKIELTHLAQDSNPKYTFSDDTPVLGGADTDDKIFILNYTDLNNTDYGFCEWPYTRKCTQVKYTDYGRTMTSADASNDKDNYTYGYYWLRTPGMVYGRSMWISCLNIHFM